MKVADLDPQPRRLLRHCGRIDPGLATLTPGELAAAGELRGYGLIDVTDGAVPVTDDDPVRDGVQYFAGITDAGRKALR